MAQKTLMLVSSHRELLCIPPLRVCQANTQSSDLFRGAPETPGSSAMVELPIAGSEAPFPMRLATSRTALQRALMSSALLDVETGQPEMEVPKLPSPKQVAQVFPFNDHGEKRPPAEQDRDPRSQKLRRSLSHDDLTDPETVGDPW